MNQHLIVVVNRSLARFFTLDPVAIPELESGPRIRVYAELENQEISHGKEMFADSKTGRGAAPTGGGVHGYDDKRNQHFDELRRRFALKVIDQIDKALKANKSKNIILASSARMRRFLYPEIDRIARQGLKVHKLSKNIINFTPQKIHELLAEEGLVPEQK